MTIIVPVWLAALALLDAGCAGYRAATGRNGRIRKRPYYRRAIGRGVATGTLGLAIVGLAVAIVLARTVNPAARYDVLVNAGTRELVMATPFAVLVVGSLLAYWALPMRSSTFVILVGLGPCTLVRPVVVLGVTGWSVAGSGDWLVWVVAIAAALSVLAVEPVVHRRWYRATA